MFALGIRYLMGWAMAASDGAKKEHAEWPPHPDRVFMALAATWFETGEDVEEGKALRWLEELPAPALAVSEAEHRSVVRSYVPVNDTSLSKKNTIAKLVADAQTQLGALKKAGLSQLPEHRSRQDRGFPVAVPHNPVLHLIWRDADPGAHLNSIESLARKFTHIGHSASLAQLWVEDSPNDPAWLPAEASAPLRLRIPSRGRLTYLAERCNRAQVISYTDMDAQREAAKGRDRKRLAEKMEQQFGGRTPVSQRPEAGHWQGYARPGSTKRSDAPGSLFDSRLLVLALSGKRLSLRAALKLTEALRGVMLKSCPQPIPEWLSGHASDGAASKNPHVALLPLPFVGAEHADGRIMGLAMAVPRDVSSDEAARCLYPLLWNQATGESARTRLFDGEWFECTAELDHRESPPFNLRVETWTRSAKIWASVTPVVLDRHFDGADKWERAAETVKDACERIGLPRPHEVLLHPVSLVEGVPHAREFPYLTRKQDGGRMHHSHAMLIFEQPVSGPIILGAGRFRGYGLCRPIRQGEKNRA